MTRNELKRRILEGVGDDPDSPVFFSSTQLNELVDEASEILCEDNRAIKRSAVVPLKEGIGFIYTPSIAADFMAPIRIFNYPLGQRLTCLSMAELDGLNVTWQTVTGRPEVWFPVSWDIVGLYPRPAAGDGSLKIDYVAWPRGLMDDGDRSELPEATHDALVLYGQYMGCLKKWDSQSATVPLQALQAHKSVAFARSGISRISVRSMQRSQVPHSQFPSNYDIGGS